MEHINMTFIKLRLFILFNNLRNCKHKETTMFLCNGQYIDELANILTEEDSDKFKQIVKLLPYMIEDYLTYNFWEILNNSSDTIIYTLYKLYCVETK
jgi:hypothetical protein